MRVSLGLEEQEEEDAILPRESDFGRFWRSPNIITTGVPDVDQGILNRLKRRAPRPGRLKNKINYCKWKSRHFPVTP